MPLDPQCRALIDAMSGAPIDWNTVDVASARVGMTLQPPLRLPAVARVEERAIPGPGGPLPVRIYWPVEGARRPGLVFFHGGGFVLCNLDTHDDTCRSLCVQADCVVVSVDYRLAPEHPFPAGPEDCYAATRWTLENADALGVDARRIAIGGDSAGGCLSAVVAQMARDRSGPKLCFQLMIYPVTDFSFGTPSYKENAEGYFLTTTMMKWFWRHYLAKPEDGAHPYASPLRAQNLKGLPPGLVITAEFDPLRDEGEAYAERLRAAGNDVQLSRYDGMIHGFFGMGAQIDRARDAVREAAAALRGAFSR
jgi:acetyl esterase